MCLTLSVSGVARTSGSLPERWDERIGRVLELHGLGRKTLFVVWLLMLTPNRKFVNVRVEHCTAQLSIQRASRSMTHKSSTRCFRRTGGPLP